MQLARLVHKVFVETVLACNLHFTAANFVIYGGARGELFRQVCVDGGLGDRLRHHVVLRGLLTEFSVGRDLLVVLLRELDLRLGLVVDF